MSSEDRQFTYSLINSGTTDDPSETKVVVSGSKWKFPYPDRELEDLSHAIIKLLNSRERNNGNPS